MSRENRILDGKMEEEFISGTLKPLLEVVKRDRDLILEFRDPFAAAIYCKGQSLEIKSSRDGDKIIYSTISADKKFLEEGSLRLQSAQEAELFVKEKLPFVKQRMAEHRSEGMEIEFEQALIRANNLEAKLNTDYFIVDRQALLASGQDRIDVLGIYWPDHGSSEDVSLALIEVKFSLYGGIETLAEQVKGYYNALAKNIVPPLPDGTCEIMGGIADHTEKLLQQKLRLGLITGASNQALEKLRTKIRVSRDPKRVKIVVAMVDYNLRSPRLSLQIPKLRRLEDEMKLKYPIEVMHLGYGLWAGNAVRDLSDIPPVS
jgi:hypothetical protein